MSFVVVRGQLAPRYRDEKISDYQRQWRISVKSCLERKSVVRSCFFLERQLSLLPLCGKLLWRFGL